MHVKMDVKMDHPPRPGIRNVSAKKIGKKLQKWATTDNPRPFSSQSHSKHRNPVKRDRIPDDDGVKKHLDRGIGPMRKNQYPSNSI